MTRTTTISLIGRCVQFIKKLLRNTKVTLTVALIVTLFITLKP